MTRRKQYRPLSFVRLSFITIITSLIIVLIIAVVWGSLAYQVSPHSNFPAPTSAQNSELDEYTQNTPREMKLRGRRGIIKEINTGTIVVTPNDGYARVAEELAITTLPVTTYILITIPRMPGNRDAVLRTPVTRDTLSVFDDVFIVSHDNITASSSFSALRIEKIVTP